MTPYLSQNNKYSKSYSLLLVLIAYFIASTIAIYSYSYFTWLQPIWAILMCDVIATVVIWLIGIKYHNASLYDPYWSVAPMVITISCLVIAGIEFADINLRQSLLLLVMFYWAIRLTSNWVRDWPGLMHEDWRYQEMRANNGRLYQLTNLFGICLFPTLLVFTGMLPIFSILLDSNQGFNVIDIIACIIGLSAITIQLIADQQMRDFRRSKNGKTGFMKSGLWAWSRHPNYFGEICFWFSLWLFGMASFGLSHTWTAIGWLLMLALFYFISCPWMDQRSASKRVGYSEYMQQSTMLFPWPPK